MTDLPIDETLPQIIDALGSALGGRGGAPGLGQDDPGSAGHPRFGPARGRPSGRARARTPAGGGAGRGGEDRRRAGWSLGGEVGYQVRFDRRFSPQTPLRFLTEGILTRQLLADPFLEQVGAVVLDEFHERNLNSDLALALLHEVRREVRPDLVLIVMSATLDASSVSRFLDDCPIVRSQGRAYDVALEYRPVSRPASAEALVPLLEERLADPGDGGHLLVFLPGMAEIRRVLKRLQPAAARAGALVLPLHGSLPPEEQDLALRPSPRRKVILATNVAETSLTIEGVSTVVDTGLARIVRYDAERGIDRWELARVSRASADQRAGRAGRTGPGHCIRLWSEREQRGLPEFEQPEIHRVDLCSTVLALHAWGTAEPSRFSWYDAPAPERLAAAERLLTMLGGLAGSPPRITALGTEMLKLPVHPRLARLLVAARQAGRERDGATIAALLSERDIRTSGHGAARGSNPASDDGGGRSVRRAGSPRHDGRGRGQPIWSVAAVSRHRPRCGKAGCTAAR